jgi:membrane protein insertase Oxa1/YidC/SpoIIIJ
VDDGTDPMKDLPSTKFSKQILKSVIGETRANQVMTSLSMAIIPNVLSGSMGGGIKDCKYILRLISFNLALQASKSTNDMGN